jgi:hypothetical protein
VLHGVIWLVTWLIDWLAGYLAGLRFLPHRNTGLRNCKNAYILTSITGEVAEHHEMHVTYIVWKIHKDFNIISAG